MTYYINPIWIYLISIANTLDVFLTIISVVGGVILVIFGFAYMIDAISDELDSETRIRFSKYMKRLVIFIAITSLLSAIIPSKTACREMLVASIVTHENVDKATEDIKEVIDYAMEKIGELK